MSGRFYWGVVVLTGLSVVPISAQTPTFGVLVLDALNGEPQSGVKVNYLCEGQEIKRESVNTGSDGKAEIPYKCENGVQIEISLLPPGDKEECGEVVALTIREILTKGFISEPTSEGNIWCPNKQKHKLERVPGQVTVFVKKPTWWQAHVATF